MQQVDGVSVDQEAQEAKGGASHWLYVGVCNRDGLEEAIEVVEHLFEFGHPLMNSHRTTWIECHHGWSVKLDPWLGFAASAHE